MPPLSSPTSSRLTAVRASLCLIGVLLALGATAACAPTSPAGAPSGPLPAYAGEDLDLFDDTIDPHAVGLELDAHIDPKRDPRVRSRVRAADVVLRARIQTVTGEAGAGARSYQIILKSLGQIVGSRPIGDEFTLHIDKSSPSHGIVKSLEGEMVGKTLIVYAKAFARPDGERDLHFHASADEPDVIAAVKTAAILDSVK
jgi:hypothetical protein